MGRTRSTVKGPKDEAGFTLIELLVVVAIIGVLAAIGVTQATRARVTANETSAVGSMRAINGGQMSYAASAGNGGFAADLATLATPCTGSARGFISPDLDPTSPGVTTSGASGVMKSGYTIDLAATGASPGNDCNGTPTGTDYAATAVPVSPGISGIRGFNTSGAGTIFFDTGGLPTGTTPIQ
jgi:prepilin-type N-terminal cleavage/methylation domain-containing protein